jgi:GAF domain-containing protein
VEKSLLQILNEAREATGAAYGTIQLYDDALGGLRIVAQYGFTSAFLDVFRLVRADDPCACGRALRLAHRVIVPDVMHDPFFPSSLPIAQQGSFRGVQATPVLNNYGKVIAVLGTYYIAPCHLSRVDMRIIDECVMRVAGLFQPSRKYDIRPAH